MSELGEQYINDYDDIFFEEETNTAKIYKAFNKQYQRDCCLKIISKENLKNGDYDSLLEQIRREEELTKVCNSEHTVNFYRKMENENYIIFELENCDLDLKSYLDNNGDLMTDLDFFRDIVISISKALQLIHKKGIMHRDIKPQNMFMINNNDGTKTIKLGDFGCSIYIKDNTSQPIGTIFYTAPEIIKNLKYDEKCDLWSLGVSLYELCFGVLPYGPEPTTNVIMDIIYDEQNFRLKKTGIPTLDILFYKLIQINPNKRMDFNEFFDFVFDKDFMKKDIVYENYQKLYETISKIKDVEYKILLKKESNNKEEIEKENADKICSFVKGGHLPDLMMFPNGYKYINNIIYYDENIDQYKKSINQDSDYFERMTPGAFILCTNLKSLGLIREEILSNKKKDNRISFNLITTGSKCKIVMEFLKEKKDFEDCIKHVCVYCWNVAIHSKLKNEYKIIDIVCNTQKEVINFIHKFASEDIKAYPLTKLIRYQDYVDKYKERHYAISKFYGDLTVDLYKKNIEEVKKLIEKEGENNELKILGNDKKKLAESFLTFDIKKDIEALDKLIIKEYTKNTFYGDLNKWLMNMNSTMNSYEAVAYFTSRLMYSLNRYGVSNKMYYNQNKEEVRRGMKIPYSCLLPYERAKGKVILLSGFTSTTLDEIQARNFSGRDKAKEQYETNLIFSVIYIIQNHYKKDWIANGVNIENESVFKTEREILYQPFSFYYVRDVHIHRENFTADIYLETIGKKEILEEKIQKGENIEYNEVEKIMQVKKK